MNDRENTLRAIRFERPDHIPMSFHINDACWRHYPQDALFDLMQRHRFLFPDFRKPAIPYAPAYAAVARKGEPFADDWGCLWETGTDGLTGVVTRHPLADWASFDQYRFPDPNRRMGIGPVDWDAVGRQIRADRLAGKLTAGGLRHGHTFLQLSDIRGYQNLLFDMVDQDPRLDRLIAAVEAFNLFIIGQYVRLRVDIVGYAEDLGMQNGPMLSPALFRAFIKPSYQRLMQPAREAGLIVHMHSDGHLHALIDDILEGGVEVINLQDLVNGLDWIADRFAGKVCVELDIDRQLITAQGTPAQIDALIRDEVRKIGRREGGLMMIFGLYPGTPLENVAALMDAMERYAGYFS